MAYDWLHCSFGGSFTPGMAPVRLAGWMVGSVVVLMWTMIVEAGTGNCWFELSACSVVGNMEVLIAVAATDRL